MGSRTSTPFEWAWAEELSVPGLDSLPALPGGGPHFQVVDPEYFATMELDLLAGRTFEGADGTGENPTVLVVSETMAQTLWPGESALGRCVKRGDQDAPCLTVVGMVEDASNGSIQADPFMQYYLPMSPLESAFTTEGAYLRMASGMDGGTAAVLRRGALEATPGIRFADIQTLREILNPQARSWTLGATMFSVFGVLALVVAGIGLYSVLAYSVARRTRELGIRAAVGARRSGLVSMVVREGVRLTVLGLFLGIGMALLAGDGSPLSCLRSLPPTRRCSPWWPCSCWPSRCWPAAGRPFEPAGWIRRRR